MEDHGVGYSLSGLVAQMRENDMQWQQGEVTVKLAKAYGYCWGVERAVRMAYEARNANPDKKLYITNEIIHNPEVNQVSEVQQRKLQQQAGGVRQAYQQLQGCRSNR
jgi:4-hydroxy-3-methylbut-2-enyl diphosphate reductase